MKNEKKQIVAELIKIAYELSDYEKHERNEALSDFRERLTHLSNDISRAKEAPFFKEDKQVLSNVEEELDRIRKTIYHLQ